MSLEAIRRELGVREEVEFATLFGSRQAGTARSDSDWDVAIFLSEKLDKFERFRVQREIAAALAPAVNVNIVILNEVSPLLAHRALGGDPIVQRSREAFLEDRRLQASSERWLQLAGECSIDLANHVIADRGFRRPSTYREAFDVLRDEGVLPAELASKMKGWAGMRNVLVHLYLDVDHEILWNAIENELDDLREFLSEMSGLL